MCTSTLHTNNNVGRNEDEQEKNCARANVLVCCAPSKVNRIFHCCCCFLLRFILSHYLSLKVSLVAYLLDNVFVFVCLFVCVFTVQLATGIVFGADMSNEIFDDVVYFDFDTKWTIYDRKKQKKKRNFSLFSNSASNRQDNEQLRPSKQVIKSQPNSTIR